MRYRVEYRPQAEPPRVLLIGVDRFMAGEWALRWRSWLAGRGGAVAVVDERTGEAVAAYPVTPA